MCVPVVSDEVATWAVPPAFRVTGAPTLEPSILNCTVPGGDPATDVRVEVKVTVCPRSDGFAEDVRPTDGVALVLVRLNDTKDVIPMAAAITL